MTLSELFSLPEEERRVFMMEVIKKATEAQLKVMGEAEKIHKEKKLEEDFIY